MSGGINIGDAFVRLLLGDTSQFEKQVNDKVTKTGDKAGQTMGQKLAHSISTGFGAVAGGLLVGATEQASKFEDELRTIQTVAPNLNLDKTRDDIIALSKESGKSVDELSSGFYDLVSAGVDADKAINVLRDSSHLAVGALGSTGQAVDIVTSAMGAFGIKAEQSGHVADVFAQAVADGKTTVDGLSQGFSRVGPLAAAAGVSFEEVASSVAIMTLKGATASVAYADVANAISALLTPNAELNKLSEKTGINFAELAKTQGLTAALEAVRKATNGDEQAFAKALGSSEALTFALSVTGDNAGQAASEFDKMKHASDGGGTALEQYNIKSQSAVEQGKRLIANIQAFIIQIGAPFVNSIGPAVFAINQLGQAFGLNNILAKALGATVGGLVGNLGGRLLGVLKGSLGVALSTGTAAVQGWFQTLLTTAVTKVQLPIQSLLNRAQIAALDAFSYLGSTSAGVFVKNFLANTALGRLAATAAGLIGPIAIAATIVLVGGNIAQGVQDQNTKDLSDNLSAALQAGTDQAVKDAEKHLADLERGARASHNDSWLNIILGQKATFEKDLQDRARTLETAENVAATNARGAGKATAGAFTTGFAEGGAAFSAVVTKMYNEALTKNSTTSKKIAHEQGLRTAQALAQGYQDGKDGVQQQWKSFLDILKNAESPMKERARLLGELTSKELQKGLHSQDPYVRATAQTTKQQIIDRLEQLGSTAHNIGKKGMEELRKGMKSKDADIRIESTAIFNAVSGKIRPLVLDGYLWGQNMAANLAKGIHSKYDEVAVSAAGLASIVTGHVRTRSPAKMGPLSQGGGPEGYGRNIGLGFAKGIGSSYSVVKAMSDYLASGVSMHPGAWAHAGVYRPAGDALGGLAGAGAGASVTINGGIHISGAGSDVSPAAAKRFGQQIVDEMGKTFRQQGARIGLHPAQP